MKLPNAEHAIVDIEKLRNYCLNPEHRRGSHKARVFMSSCGLTVEHVEELQEALLAAALTCEAELGSQDDYGQRYVLEFEVAGPQGVAKVRSAWIIRHKEDFPRFVTCYIL